MWETDCNMKIRKEKMGLWLITFSKLYVDACFYAQIVPLTRRVICDNFQGLFAKTCFYFFILRSRVRFIKYGEYSNTLEESSCSLIAPVSKYLGNAKKLDVL
jgi:hypothetical protein